MTDPAPPIKRRARKPTFASGQRAALAAARALGHRPGPWEIHGPYTLEGATRESPRYVRSACALCGYGVAVHDEEDFAPTGPAVREECAAIRRRAFEGAALTLRRRAEDLVQSATDLGRPTVVEDPAWVRSTLAYLEKSTEALRAQVAEARRHAERLDGW